MNQNLNKQETSNQEKNDTEFFLRNQFKIGNTSSLKGKKFRLILLYIIIVNISFACFWLSEDVYVYAKEGYKQVSDAKVKLLTNEEDTSAGTYQVAFYGNGSTDGVMDRITCTYNSDCQLSPNTFVRKGYSFKGWGFKTGGIIYKDGAVLSYSSAVNKNHVLKLYARWSIKKINVTFKCNTGKLVKNSDNKWVADYPDKKMTYTYDDDTNKTTNDCYKASFDFDGWNTKIDGTGITYTDDEVKSNDFIDSNSPKITLYAKWKVNYDFGKKISDCSSSSSNSNVVPCVSKHKMRSFQSFAITDNYIYFSMSKSGATNKKNSNNYIMRINLQNNDYQEMMLEKAGHGQSFDVESQKNNGDMLFVNYFGSRSTLYEGSKTTTVHNGVTYTSFSGNTSGNGKKVIPDKAIAFVGNRIQPKSFKSYSAAEIPSVLDTIRNNHTNYTMRPQVAVDEKNDHIALFVDRKVVQKTETVDNKEAKIAYVYIYKLSDFLKNKLTLIKSFKTHKAIGQGAELYGNYFYYYAGVNTGVVTRWEWNNIETNGYDADASKYSKYKKVVRFSIDGEGEGITINKGKVYVASFSINNDDRFISIYYVKNI